MQEKNERQKKSLGFYVTLKEFEQIRQLYAQTACRSLSEYLRKVSLRKPVVGITRNQTAEELMLELIEIKNALLNLLNNLHPDNESTTQTMITRFEQTCLRMDQIYELCSRK